MQREYASTLAFCDPLDDVALADVEMLATGGPAESALLHAVASEPPASRPAASTPSRYVKWFMVRRPSSISCVDVVVDGRRFRAGINSQRLPSETVPKPGGEAS